MLHEPSVLAALEFSDLYLEPDRNAWFRRGSSDRQRWPLEGSALAESRALREFLQEHQTGGVDVRVDWGGMRLRGQRVPTVDGDLFVCRRALDAPIKFKDLGLPPKLQRALLAERLTAGGLVLFTGATSAGKTTTQGAWLAARLEQFGGVTCTVENPVEMALAGRHGEGDVTGICYQSEVRRDADFGPAIEALLRAAPNMIGIGEIRNPAAAGLAMLAGTSGHLVSSTIHANDVLSGLERIKNMLRGSGYDPSIVGDSLAAILHQKLSVVGTGGSTRKVLTLTPLIVTGATNEEGIRAMLRKGEMVQLVSEVERQRRIMTLSDDALF